MAIGPPRGAFPIASLFVLLALFAAMWALWSGGLFNPYLSSLAFGVLAWMFVYVVIGDFFAQRKSLGQILFLLLGFVLVVGGGLLANAFKLHLDLVPLSTLGPLSADLTINGVDYTWLLPVGFLLILYYARDDLKRLRNGETGF